MRTKEYLLLLSAAMLFVAVQVALQRKMATAQLPTGLENSARLMEKQLNFSPHFPPLPVAPDLQAGVPTVLWLAPFFSGGGYCTEATAFVQGLLELPMGRLTWLTVQQHGDAESVHYMRSMRPAVKAMLSGIAHPENTSSEVVVCHSHPEHWSEIGLCGSSMASRGGAVMVGRTMFETDRLPHEWLPALLRMDEIWVPTRFNQESFARNGVPAEKIHVVPEAVDTAFFDPAVTVPLEEEGLNATGRNANRTMMLPGGEGAERRFLSIFKWEWRKGWDILLWAFLREFIKESPTSRPEAVLYILTTKGETTGTSAFDLAIARFVQDQKLPSDRLPPVRLLPDWESWSQEDLPRLYRSVDALVQPSRGEGWGRPHVEAMSMGIPVIATNWSGPTAFLDDSVGYPLSFDGLEDVARNRYGNVFHGRQGHKWAKPSRTKLRQLLRAVVDDPIEARARGIRARQRIEVRYGLANVASVVLSQLQRAARQRRPRRGAG